mmetsp:Transcript_16156/g.61197  ORF Transcript_16156/g.61197 Transcript_16156/m.61197 type:complete len:230 (-) Transcript_16156:458-1147(-)
MRFFCHAFCLRACSTGRRAGCPSRRAGRETMRSSRLPSSSFLRWPAFPSASREAASRGSRLASISFSRWFPSWGPLAQCGACLCSCGCTFCWRGRSSGSSCSSSSYPSPRQATLTSPRRTCFSRCLRSSWWTLSWACSPSLPSARSGRTRGSARPRTRLQAARGGECSPGTPRLLARSWRPRRRAGAGRWPSGLRARQPTTPRGPTRPLTGPPCPAPPCNRTTPPGPTR